jgi:2-dehydropantoate 2-reductase
VVGAGAMGCLFAARLRLAGFPVALVEKVPERRDTIAREGIRAEGVTGEYTVPVPMSSGKPSLSPDVTLVFVKSSDTREAADSVKPWLDRDSSVLTLQNGLGNVEILAEILGKGRVLGGTTSEAATLLSHGKIRHAGQGKTLIAPLDGPATKAREIASAFLLAGFESEVSQGLDSLLWGKLIVNVGINAIAAITRLRNGQLPQFPEILAMIEEAVKEAAAVAKAKNVTLPHADPLSRVLEVCSATSDNVSSMLQDVLNKRPTEIDAINGAVVREGKALGIPTPINRTLTSLVRVIQQTYLTRVVGRFDE